MNMLVSLCMITRNEAHCLAFCLNSVRHLVQEIIVVDTGSADGTPDVAARYGARVFAFPWGEDFAAARNYSLAHATGEWILVLDADEILAPVRAEELAALLAAPGVEGYFVTVRSYLGSGEEAIEDQVVRLFRNRPAYRFEGAIHEQVAGSIKRHYGGGGLACSPLLIHHFGYLDRQVQAKNKRRRNIGVIVRALGEKPADPFLLYSLGIEYLQGGEAAQGTALLERALALARGDEGYFRDLLLLLCLGLWKSGQKERLAFYLDGGLSMRPADPDLRLLRGVLALGEGRCAAAVEELRRALAAGAQILPRHQVHTLLGDACSSLGRDREAEEEYLAALRCAPHHLYPLTKILGLKKEGRGGLPWDALSRFASPARKRALAERLRERGEFPLVLVLALLTVIEAAAEGEADLLAESCRDYHFLVEQWSAAEPRQALSRRCLLAGAEEMLLAAGALQRGLDCPFFSLARKIYRLAGAALELVVGESCLSRLPETPDLTTEDTENVEIFNLKYGGSGNTIPEAAVSGFTDSEKKINWKGC
ncbi:MAG: glycosyltransferase [Moorella sp. (in: Bacteria)]|nr:glycosyltransferase [Moorella sp. (in: firmicutes)]